LCIIWCEESIWAEAPPTFVISIAPARIEAIINLFAFMRALFRYHSKLAAIRPANL
jgi:hypothetical protein